MPLLIILFSFALWPSRALGGSEVMLDGLAHHPIVLLGEVNATQAHDTTGVGCTFCTLITVRVHRYIKGSGPATAHLALDWLNTNVFATFAGNGAPLPVPSTGDSAIFWIGIQRPFALLNSPAQVWTIKQGRIDDLGWSLSEALDAIAAADSSQSFSTRFKLARHAVFGDDISRSACTASFGPAFCFRVAVRETLKGEPLSDSPITVVYDIRTAEHKRRPGDLGLYLLADPTPDGWYQLLDTVNDYLPASDDATLPAYRSVSMKMRHPFREFTVPPLRSAAWWLVC